MATHEDDDGDDDDWQEHVEYETCTVTVGRGTRSFPLDITQVAELPATANLFMLLEQSQRAAAGELNDTEISGKKVWAGSLLLCQLCLLLQPGIFPLNKLLLQHGNIIL